MILLKINFVLFLINIILWAIVGNLPAAIGWFCAFMYYFDVLVEFEKETPDEPK